MYTEITLSDGSKVTHVTEQYQVGTYLIINNDPSKQGCIHTKEPAYHLNLRRRVIKDGTAKLTAGSILDYRGKEPINDFHKEGTTDG